MNKPSQPGPTEISSAELNEYVDGSSSFAFELQVLKRFNDLEFRCEHGGSYVDAASGKVRQFDIRARWERGDKEILCAVECKSLSRFAPLLVLSVPRRTDESYHEIIMAMDEKTRLNTGLGRSLSYYLTGRHCGYRIDDPVGKSCAQVSKIRGEVSGKDTEIYDRWSQALASASDLVEEAGQTRVHRNVMMSAVLPILVVPDGMLWQIQFDQTGAKTRDPEQVRRCSYFVGHSYQCRTWPDAGTFRVSHLEIVTLSGLNLLLDDVWNSYVWFERPYHIRSAFGE